MSKSLITGGLGYVGRSLARHLVESGEEVVLLDTSSAAPAPADIRESVTVVRADLGHMAEVLEVVRAHQVDCIYHLGAMITMPAEANPWAAYDANANGTYHVLEAARIFSIGPVVFLSGIATYGPGAPETVNEDVFQSNPSQIYAATKIFGERLGEYYHQRFKIDFRCASLPAICGPGRREGLAAYPSLMVHESVRGRTCTLPVEPESQLPFIYIKDVLRCLTMLRSARAESLKRCVYSINGFSLPAGEMANAVRKRIPGAHIELLADEKVAGLVRRMPKHVDDTRARTDWGWKAEYDWDAAVTDFMATLVTHPDLYP
ncbi:MAG: NAD-dependent epimerase/dehydratase family protein [Dehalococcoidia bacterium]|nr:NAD-dependent epimerase/dehydratase family protein [Dehalococcoidia bacterium]